MKKEVVINETLNTRYDSKNNSFKILSIIMSLLIIYFHAYPLFYGNATKNIDIISKILNGENLGSIVVAMFFIISGFMIITSIKNSKNIWQYLWKRIKKIFPPLILCLTISALVIAPLVSKIDFIEYIKTPSYWFKYIFDNIVFIKENIYNIADVFIRNPYTSAINGSIWTLKYQFLMYILIIPIFLIFIKDNKNKLFKYFFILLLVITMITYTGYYDLLIEKINGKLFYFKLFLDIKWIIRLSYYFFAGVFINIYSDKINCNKYIIWTLIAVLLLTFRTNIFKYICLVLLPYFTVVIGSIKSKIKIKVPDLSYHIYIWAFPIQQLIMYYLNDKIGIYLYILLSIIITIIISYISYYISEYPFKKKRVI